MPVTRSRQFRPDGVARDPAGVAADIVKYSDLDLRYRAGEPDFAGRRAIGVLGPGLSYARKLGARFVLAEGVMFVDQLTEATSAFARRSRRTKRRR